MPRTTKTRSPLLLYLKPSQPPINLDDLVTMLEIDLLVMGDRTAFADHINRAIRAAVRQGAASVFEMQRKARAGNGAGSRT